MEATVHEPEEQSVAMRLWEKFKNESAFIKYAPFMICLAAGDLDLETFCNYAAQEASFVGAFPIVFEMLEEWIGKDDRYAIGTLRNSVWSTMLKIHSSFVTECGFNMDGRWSTSSNSEVDKCKNFLLATAVGIVAATPDKMKVAAYTIGAMTPLLKLHNFLSKEFNISALLDPNERNRLCQIWIDNCSSESFEEATLQTENLLDQLSISLTQEEFSVLEKIYHQAMKLEMNFFSAQTISQETIVPLSGTRNLEGRHLTIFSDFDLTCTTAESSATLAEITICSATRADLGDVWGALKTQYTQEYEQCINSILSSEKVEEFNYDDLCIALEKHLEFKKQSNSRVFESAVLKGLNLEDIKEAGESFKLQDGCIEFFKKIVNNNAQVHLLSNCWCGDFVRSVFSSGGLDHLSLHTNEFIYKESISIGEIVMNLETHTDKVQLLKNIVKNDGMALSVYIGDSVSDLLCLLEADVGIVFGSNSSLRKVGNHFGVSFVPLFSGLMKKQREYVQGGSFNWSGKSGILYTVTSWFEIHAFILGWSTQDYTDLLDFQNIEN